MKSLCSIFRVKSYSLRLVRAKEDIRPSMKRSMNKYIITKHKIHEFTKTLPRMASNNYDNNPQSVDIWHPFVVTALDLLQQFLRLKPFLQFISSKNPILHDFSFLNRFCFHFSVLFSIDILFNRQSQLVHRHLLTQYQYMKK